MAKATLPTNYRDDILNASTEGKRKYRMNYNDDGTVSFVDVTPYDQEGSVFGAGDINATNEAVNQSFDKSKLIRDMDAINALTQEGYAPDALALKDVNESLGGVSQFIVDETTGKITGYKTEIGGADTVFPFKSEPFIFNNSGSYKGSPNGYTTNVSTLDVSQYTKMNYYYTATPKQDSTRCNLLIYGNDGILIVETGYVSDNYLRVLENIDISNYDSIIIQILATATTSNYTGGVVNMVIVCQ